jgi:hypothetical protein
MSKADQQGIRKMGGEEEEKDKYGTTLTIHDELGPSI